MTVSRALHRPELLSKPMRDRVLDAVRTVGYTPDLVAQSLASNRTGIVAAVVPTLGNPLFSEMLDGIQEKIAPLGYHLILANSHYATDSEEALIAALLGRRPDGLILVGVAHTPGTRALLHAAALPVVELWDLTDDPIDMLVGFSNVRAARAMVEHLAATGRRNIVHVTGSAGDAARALGRRRGYEAAMKQLGLGEPWTLEVAGPSSYASGAEAIRMLYKDRRTFDAVFFSDDVMAAGAVLECQARGIAVPGQIGIAGFGDAELSARLCPALTTVRIDRGQIGRCAATLLALRMQGKSPADRIIDVGFCVMKRESA
jgi:LacI family transcriptional regulator, gluconate utilization system Gnt-I transcriptional repressor